MAVFLREFWKDQSGQSMAEYGLLTALIAVAGLAAVRTLGASVSEKLEQLAEAVKGG